MTYFELFDIPVSLRVNTPELRTRFFELSRKYHPDFFTNASPSEQTEALHKSALLNQAWKTFQDPDATIKYVLMSKGLLAEEEKYELPPDFLSDVMDINEQMMDDEEVTSDPAKKVNDLQNEIYAPVQEIIENYQDDTTSPQELLQVKEYYYKKKYLDRIRQQLLK